MTYFILPTLATATLETAPTCYIEGHGIRFAYRRLGPATATLLVLLQPATSMHGLRCRQRSLTTIAR